MAGKATGRRKGDPAVPATVKVTLRLSMETAQRLGVEASMRRVTMSAIVEGVMGPYLKRWRLPSTIEDGPGKPAVGSGDAGREGAA